MIKILIALFFLVFNYTIHVKAQVSCDTSLLIKNFAQIQFDHSGARDLQEYRCLKNNQKAQKYLLKLLKKEWNREDYIEYVYKIVNRDSISLNKQTIHLTKKNSSRYKIVYDSLKEKEIKTFENIFLSEKVYPYLITIAGYLHYKESIPILKKLLTIPNLDPQYIYNIRLSLARLGDTASENQVIKLTEKDTLDFGGMLNKLKDIYFIRSQRGIYNLAQLLKSKRKAILISESRDEEYISYEFLNYLKSIIANKDLQDYFIEKDKHRKPYAKDIDAEDIQFAIRWFEKNKGKYIIKED